MPGIEHLMRPFYRTCLQPVPQKRAATVTAMQPEMPRKFSRVEVGPLVVILATWLVVVLIFLPPYVGVGPRVMLMSAFSSVCHQIPGRSPDIEGIQLAVCHRCIGIFTGLAVASLLFALLVRSGSWMRDKALLVILVSLTPLALDWGLDAFGIWNNSPFTRTLTGATFGLSMGALLVAAVRKPRPPGGAVR